MRIAPGILISVTRIEINIASNTVCPLTVAGIEKLLHFGIGRLAPAWVTRNRKRVCTGSSRSSRQRSQTTVTVPSIVPSTSASRDGKKLPAYVAGAKDGINLLRPLK